MDVNSLWELERGFWLDGVCFYEMHLHGQARMILPGVGILDRASILQSLREAPRWADIRMHDRAFVETGGFVFLAYAATAQREGEQPYRAVCGSAYLCDRDAWVMITHQQTPVS